MAIPSRQIGGSTTTNLLWQISKQLEELICVRSCGCGSTTTTTSTVAPTTTTTTTTVLSTNYNVEGCAGGNHVITYTGEGELLEGTIVNNDTLECWIIIDPTTDPADVGTIDTVYGEGSRCETCIPTTTTTTTIVLVRINLASFGLSTPCTPHIPPAPIIAYTSAACLAAITVGCIMYADNIGTLLSPGYYDSAGGYFYVNNLGEIVNIGVCPQP